MGEPPYRALREEAPREGELGLIPHISTPKLSHALALMACLVAEAQSGAPDSHYSGEDRSGPWATGVSGPWGSLSLNLYCNKRTHVKAVIIIDLELL